MLLGCLYCGLQLPDTAGFCPQCGRLVERGFIIRPYQVSESNSLDKEMKGKNYLKRLQEADFDGRNSLAYTQQYVYLGNCPKCGVHLSRRNCNIPTSVEDSENIVDENERALVVAMR